MLQDLRYAFRSLRRTPEFALTVVVTLALGVAVNCLIFTVVNAALLRPLPYPGSDRLVMVWEVVNLNPNRFADPKAVPNRKWWLTNRELPRFAAGNHSFAALGGYTPREVNLAGWGEPARLDALLVTPEFFDVLGIRPVLGRLFTPDEDRFGENHVVLLSYGLWQQRFSGDPRVIGSQVLIDEEPHRIIGVLPAGTRTALPNLEDGKTDLWLPSSHQMTPARRFALYMTVGRLKPGVGIGQARADLEAIEAQLERERKRGLVAMNLVPLLEEISGNVRPALLILLGAVGCVLLIGCANIANLLLARNAARQTEMALRAALGAQGGRLFRYCLAESLLLGLAGGIAGLTAARALGGALLLWIPEGIVPRLKEAAMDGRVLLFSLAISLLAALIFGLPAAWYGMPRGSTASLSETLKLAAPGAGGSRRGRSLRRLLAVAEIALAVLLVIGSGLLTRSFLRLRGVDLGFQLDRVSVLSLVLPETAYKQPAQRTAFAEEVLNRLRPVAGVQTVAATNAIPISPNFTTSRTFEIEGVENPQDQPSVFYRVVTPDYFPAMGIAIKRGRGFTPSDGEDAVIVNEAFVRRFLPETKNDPAAPLGRHIRFEKKWAEIVGLLADIKHDGPAKETQAEVYAPFAANIFGSVDIVMRSRLDSRAAAALLRDAVRSVDASFPPGQYRTMEAILGESVATPRFYMRLMALFAGLAAALAAVGIYGLISYSVVQRTHEIGVRVAIGASRRSILRLVIGEALALAAAGIGSGLLAALAATRLLQSLLFEIRPLDAATFAGVAVIFVLVAAAAGCIPAARANRIDPILTLRAE